MSQFIIRISDLLFNISSAFEGDLGRDETKKLRDEVLNGEIPNYTTDRINLKADGRNIAEDLHKALVEYKTEHPN